MKSCFGLGIFTEADLHAFAGALEEGSVEAMDN